MNPVVHFEFPYTDEARIAKFYEAAFDWKTQALGEAMGHYVTAMTTETDEARMVKTPGAINGGFYPNKTGWPAQCPSVVIGVEDINQAMEKIAKAGGKILGEPMEIPGIGLYVSFFDTEGNRNSILQPQKMSQAFEKAAQS